MVVTQDFPVGALDEESPALLNQLVGIAVGTLSSMGGIKSPVGTERSVLCGMLIGPSSSPSGGSSVGMVVTSILIHISVVDDGDCEVVVMVVVEAPVPVVVEAAVVVVAATVASAVVVAEVVVVATDAGSVMTENDIEIDAMSPGAPKSLVGGTCGRAVDCRGVPVGGTVVIAGMVSGKAVAPGALIDNETSTIGSVGTTEEVVDGAVVGIVKIGGVRMGGRLKLMDGITTENSVEVKVSVVEFAAPSKMFSVPGCNRR